MLVAYQMIFTEVGHVGGKMDTIGYNHGADLQW
jgi:hypothetical protein